MNATLSDTRRGGIETEAGRDARRRAEVLARPDWLERHLADPLVRVVEVDVNGRAFAEGHIAGAVLWDVYIDLKDGEYRLRDAAAVEALLARSGIAAESTVVFYGYAPAIGFWLLKLYGHRDARILDCSRGTWVAEGRPWGAEAVPEDEEPAPAGYPVPAPDARLRVDADEVAQMIDDPDATILDMRTRLEFDGERFWPSGGFEPGGRAGHIPSAVNLPLAGHLDEEGRFRPSGELRALFESALPRGGGPSRVAVTYCTIGARACMAWFILTSLLGEEGVRVYDGGWAEWGLIPGVQVEGRRWFSRRMPRVDAVRAPRRSWGVPAIADTPQSAPQF
ncbi:sulfurtransferase [Microterricola viridarii]|uniref:Sulfurtransferase n=1 Tax=Microterricola viridarii TaxID=412690 RepID=A0A0X8E321_9MICO|nr:rhodanese-like domain-containing protein [Microterricola viridarii]AMB58784.1 hypothetical protein AWU67_07815 [Microterricola viridarii]